MFYKLRFLEALLSVSISLLPRASLSAMSSLSESRSPLHLATLLDLPSELLWRIGAELDNGSVCALGNTSKILNAIVFPWFFKKHDLQYSLQNGRFCGGWAPPYALRAARCFLNLPPIRSITFDAVPSLQSQPLLDQVDDLRLLIERSNCVQEFTMRLTSLDLWAECESSTIEVEASLDEWQKACVSLRQQATQRGCETLEILGGGKFAVYLQVRDRYRERVYGGR